MTGAPTHGTRKSTLLIGMIAIVACSLPLLAFFWNVPRRGPQKEMRTILSSDLEPSTIATRLDRYVALGDDIAQVRRKLALTKERTQHNGRPAEWALGLGDVSLVLAIDQEGKVVGIGRHRPTDDGTLWFTRPEWDRVNPSSDALADNVESKQ